MTDETTQPAIIQTANQPIHLTPSVPTVASSSSAESVGIAANDLRKAVERDARDSINGLWHKLEALPHEALEEIIALAKKHL